MHGKAIVPPNLLSEDRLVAAAQSGDHRAIEYLVIEHPPVRALIGSLQRSVNPKSVAPRELEAAARLALLEALRGFDPDRGARFTTYAYHFIRGAMLKALYAHVERRRGADAARGRVRLVPLEQAADGEAEDQSGYESELVKRDPEYGIEPSYIRVDNAERDAAVRNFVRALPENQRKITEDVFWGERTHREIAAEHGTSRPAVTRTLQRVFARGRKELAEYEHNLAA